MDRRTVILTLLSTFMGRQRLTRGEPGQMLVDLNRWTVLTVRFEGMEIEIPPRVIFEELTKDNLSPCFREPVPAHLRQDVNP